jgi:hypothetical protein
MQWRLKLRTGQTDRLADPLLHDCRICILGFSESVGAMLAALTDIIQPQTEYYLLFHKKGAFQSVFSDQLYLCLQYFCSVCI